MHLRANVILITEISIVIFKCIGYEPAGLTVHPPQNDRGWVHFFSDGCLVPPKFFPQRKSGFCRRYSYWDAPKRGFTS